MQRIPWYITQMPQTKRSESCINKIIIKIASLATYDTSKGQKAHVVISNNGTMPYKNRWINITTTCAIFIKWL